MSSLDASLLCPWKCLEAEFHEHLKSKQTSNGWGYARLKHVTHVIFVMCCGLFASQAMLCGETSHSPLQWPGSEDTRGKLKNQWKYFSVRFWGSLSFFILDFFHLILWLIAEAVMVSHAWDDTFVDLLLALFGDPKPCGDMLRDAPVFRTCQKLFWEVNNFDFGDQPINPYV